jgi:signal transduction histidine kinase
MPNLVDGVYLSQTVVVQIKQMLALKGAIVQRFHDRPSDRWITLARSFTAEIASYPTSTVDGGTSWEKLQEVDRRLQQHEIVEFTAVTNVMNISIYNRYVFVPIFDRQTLWGRICLLGDRDTQWEERDLLWVKSIGENLLAKSIDEQEKTSTNNRLLDTHERITQLERQLAQKDEFIDRISHDLRAPLMNIKMASKMVKLSLNTDPVVSMLIEESRTQKYLRMLEEECDREVALIDRILDLQRLDLDRAGMQLESIDLYHWLPNAISGFVERTIDRQQYLISFCEQGLPPIETDLHHLGKIAIELLNNACKYTERSGQIKIEIGRSTTTVDRIVMTVSNQATIDSKHLAHIFDRFYRIPGADKYQQGGNGLGLALVQKVVHQMGGEITVDSVDNWTVFAVELPIKFPAEDNSIDRSPVFVRD